MTITITPPKKHRIQFYTNEEEYTNYLDIINIALRRFLRGENISSNFYNNCITFSLTNIELFKEFLDRNEV